MRNLPHGFDIYLVAFSEKLNFTLKETVKGISPLSSQRLESRNPKFPHAESKRKQKIAGTE